MKTKDIPIILMACCAIFAFAGCKPSVGGSNTVTASSGGREIKVVANGGVFVETQEDRFTVKVTGHEVVIDRERVLVDEKEGAKLPAGAMKFDVTVAGGTLRLAADGAEILRTPLK